MELGVYGKVEVYQSFSKSRLEFTGFALSRHKVSVQVPKRRAEVFKSLETRLELEDGMGHWVPLSLPPGVITPACTESCTAGPAATARGGSTPLPTNVLEYVR